MRNNLYIFNYVHARTRVYPHAYTHTHQVALGDVHGLALMRNGCVFSWGSGAQGKLGLGGACDSLDPVPIPYFAHER